MNVQYAVHMHLGLMLRMLCLDPHGVHAERMRGESALVGAEPQVLGDGVNDIAVASGLLPDVQLHHPQPKTLHLQSTLSC